MTVNAVSGALTHLTSVTVVVTAQDFTIGISPTATTVTRGQTLTLTVTISAVGGFSGAVTLTGSGLPAGSSATLSPNPVSGAGTAAWRIKTSASATRTTYTIRVTGKSGALTHQATASLTLR